MQDTSALDEAADAVETRRWHRVVAPRLTHALVRLLLAAWCVLLVGVVLASDRHSDLDSLERAIAIGDVDTVQVAGGVDAGAQGFSIVELRWSRGELDYYTEVLQTRGQQGGGSAAAADHTGRIRGDVATYLQEGYDQLRVEPAPFVDRSGITAHIAGWRVTGWLADAFSVLFLLTVGVLVAGAEPRRATRWAWFWLMFALSPLAGPAYLLLGGPTGPGWLPGDGRRLTGGWTLLLSMMLGSAFGTFA